MIVKIYDNEEFAGRAAADAIIAQINAKEESVLGLPTGSTPLSAYRALVLAYKEGRVSFSKVKTFNLDEYLGLPDDDINSYRYFMNENLFKNIDIDLENTHFPSSAGAEPSNYDKAIAAAGGTDLQLLGIGVNGHIGFNESGCEIDSLTHVQKLDYVTRKANSRFFGNDPKKVPEYAVTLGIKGIMNARKIVLIASGENKAQAVYDTVCGRVDMRVPASVLQLHPDVFVFLDKAAASLLPSAK